MRGALEIPFRPLFHPVHSRRHLRFSLEHPSFRDSTISVSLSPFRYFFAYSSFASEDWYNRVIATSDCVFTMSPRELRFFVSRANMTFSSLHFSSLLCYLSPFPFEKLKNRFYFLCALAENTSVNDQYFSMNIYIHLPFTLMQRVCQRKLRDKQYYAKILTA